MGAEKEKREGREKRFKKKMLSDERKGNKGLIQKRKRGVHRYILHYLSPCLTSSTDDGDAALAS